ncbi:MAG: ATP synthase F1 subunit epsilon [Verrucomicrobia bacterium]|nr:MAG: ATP synthase F1 subunit epsilon [Verrucomicrobiota bacterium]
MSLVLEIVTPEEKVYEETIDTVVLPTTSGEISVLPGHIPLVTKLNPGELLVTVQNKTELLVVGRGFARIEGDRVSVLAESAIEEANIDESAVEAALQRAKEALSDKTRLNVAEVDQLEGAMRYALAQLATKGRRKK